MLKKFFYINKMVSLLSKELMRKSIEDDISIVSMMIEVEEEGYIDAMYCDAKPQDYCDELHRNIKRLYQRLDSLKKRLRDTRRP